MVFTYTLPFAAWYISQPLPPFSHPIFTFLPHFHASSCISRCTHIHVWTICDTNNWARKLDSPWVTPLDSWKAGWRLVGLPIKWGMYCRMVGKCIMLELPSLSPCISCNRKSVGDKQMMLRQNKSQTPRKQLQILLSLTLSPRAILIRELQNTPKLLTLWNPKANSLH